MSKIFLFLLLVLNLNASYTEVHKWEKGMTYLSLLSKLNLPSRELYWNLTREDQRLTEEICDCTEYKIVRKDNGDVEQVFIPIKNDLTIHIYVTEKCFWLHIKKHSQ